VVFGVAFGEIVGRAEVDPDAWAAPVGRILRVMAARRSAQARSPLDPEALIIDARMRDRGPATTLSFGPVIDPDSAMAFVGPLILRACGSRVAPAQMAALTLVDP